MKKVITFLVFLFGISSAQNDSPIRYDREMGVNLGISLSGGTIGFNYRKYLSLNYSYSGSINFSWVRDSKEFTVYNYYTNAYEKINDDNSVILFPVQIEIRRRLFAEDIEESFQPFVNLGLGAVPGFNFPKKGSDENAFTGMLFAGGGFTLLASGKMAISINLQLQGIPFQRELGGRKDYSTLTIQVTIAKITRK